jgi:hypothetical protein
VRPGSIDHCTEEVSLTDEQIADTFLDGIGPMGPKGREAALQIAVGSAPEGYVFTGAPSSIRLYVKRYENSLDRG